MGVESIRSRIQYVPLSDDPNLRNRINKALDVAQNLPITISKKYPNRSNDIYTKISSIVYSNQPNIELEFQSNLKTKTYLSDMLLVMCSWGSNTVRINTIKYALERLFRMNPLPKILFVEGSTDGQSFFKYLEEKPNVSYILLDLNHDIFRNLFMKEILWNHGVEEILKVDKNINKICFMDSDVGIADMYGFQLIYDKLDEFDVVSPMRASYYVGNKPYHKKYKMLPSCGYCLYNHTTYKGWPGFGICMRMDFLERYFKYELPCSASGLGDCILWSIISNGKVDTYNKYLPIRIDCLKPYMIPNVRIGYADNVVMHFDHGPISDRTYRVYSRLLLRCVLHPFGEFIRIGQSALLGWANTEEAHMFRHCLENLLILNRKDIKLVDEKDADELFDWLTGISKHPPKKIKKNLFTLNGNIMPMSNVAVPVPDKNSKI